MSSKNERVQLEMQIMKYRQLASRIDDEEFLGSARKKIEELERKPRKIDREDFGFLGSVVGVGCDGGLLVALNVVRRIIDGCIRCRLRKVFTRQ